MFDIADFALQGRLRQLNETIGQLNSAIRSLKQENSSLKFKVRELTLENQAAKQMIDDQNLQLQQINTEFDKLQEEMESEVIDIKILESSTREGLEQQIRFWRKQGFKPKDIEIVKGDFWQVYTCVVEKKKLKPKKRLVKEGVLLEERKAAENLG